MRLQPPKAFAALLFTILCCAGCGTSEVEKRAFVVPAKGTLTWNGSPVAGAQLTFLRVEEDLEPGLATTDARGRFQCMTNDSSEGIQPGEYVVLVHHPQGQIPKRYSMAETSPLQVVVDETGDNHFSLQLTN